MDKVLLVTGASRGIGAATALLAARQGWSVAVNYAANALAADAVVRAIREAGGNAIAVQADVSDEAQVLAILGTPFRRTNSGGILVLVYAFVNSDGVGWVLIDGGKVVRRNRA